MSRLYKRKTIGNGKWYLGDCFDVLKDIPDNSIDMILCDPPYGTTSIAWDSILPFDEMWREYNRILKDGHSITLFGNFPFTAHLALSNIDNLKQALVWNKNKCGSPALAKIRHMQIHEDVLVFGKGKGKIIYNPQMQEGTPYKREKVKAKTDNHKFGFTKDDNYSYESKGTRYPTSIINISRNFSAQQQVHPTQKPVPLFEYLIKTYTHEGMTVLDNCAGSGTTAIAAENTNRKWICIEKDREYSLKAVQRINDHIEEKV